MNTNDFACGDAPITPRVRERDELEDKKSPVEAEPSHDTQEPEEEEITPQGIEEHENRLKDRIAHCRNVIEALKLELNAEKSKSQETKQMAQPETSYDTFDTSERYVYTDKYEADVSFASTMYSACVESKLNCDENLLEYEKQLEQYQNTLNMAHITKKNAIRKQMLAKAFRLKLMEVENQCNIELLRVKQSLQCLEPLQMIASKWKTGSEDLYDQSTFQLTIPQCPEQSFAPNEYVASAKNSPHVETGDEQRGNDSIISE